MFCPSARTRANCPLGRRVGTSGAFGLPKNFWAAAEITVGWAVCRGDVAADTGEDEGDGMT